MLRFKLETAEAQEILRDDAASSTEYSKPDEDVCSDAEFDEIFEQDLILLYFVGWFGSEGVEFDAGFYGEV